mgnify:CR=1 FL=1
MRASAFLRATGSLSICWRDSVITVVGATAGFHHRYGGEQARRDCDGALLGLDVAQALQFGPEFALLRERQPEIVMLGDSITHFWGGDPADVHADRKQFGDLGRGGIRLQAALVALELLLP